MGSIITLDEALHMKLKLCHMRLGLGVAANDAEAVLRGLPSLTLRYRAHDEATRALAQWSLTRAEFSQVLHPALPSARRTKRADSPLGALSIRSAPDSTRQSWLSSSAPRDSRGAIWRRLPALGVVVVVVFA